MYWEQSNNEDACRVPGDIVDVAYRIVCRCLPVDHAYALSSAIQDLLPWFQDEPHAGMHPLHGADSGNGWMRPQGPDDLLHLSKRTRLVLRLPDHHVEDAAALIGKTIDVHGHSMEVISASIKPLSAINTIYSRYVVCRDDCDEGEFMEQVAEQLDGMNIRPRKMLPGIEHSIRIPGGRIRARSIMLADLSVEESVTLQQRGLGPCRHLGCGLFIPHKDIREVREQE